MTHYNFHFINYVIHIIETTTKQHTHTHTHIYIYKFIFYMDVVVKGAKGLVRCSLL
jgi:hypothetical protein